MMSCGPFNAGNSALACSISWPKFSTIVLSTIATASQIHKNNSLAPHPPFFLLLNKSEHHALRKETKTLAPPAETER
jgi:hypothetical protein